MNVSDTPVSDLVLTGSLVNSLTSSAAAANFQLIGSLVLTSLAVSGAVVVAVLTAFCCTAAAAGARQSGSYNLPGVVAAVGFFAATLGAPIVSLIAATRNAASQLLALLVANLFNILFIVLFSVAAWVWSIYHNEIWAAGILVYEASLMPIYRVVPMYLALLLELGLATIVPWTNFLIIRLPSVLATGLFFDAATCAGDTFSAFFAELVGLFLEVSSATVVWASSGNAALVAAPNFALAGQQLAVVIGTLNTFIVCVCQSSQIVTTPFFDAITDGNPSISEPVPPFAAAFDALLGAPVQPVLDTVRPFVDFGASIGAGTSFLDSVRSARWGYNETTRNGRVLVNATALTFDAIIQQYYVFAIDEATNGDPPLTTSPGAPPRIVACVVGLVYWPAETANYLLNIVFRLESTFTSFDGQRQLYFTDVTDLLYDVVDCVCGFLRWFGALLRAIGDDIEGSSGTCTNLSASNLGPSIGGCIFHLVAAVIEAVCCIVEIIVRTVLDVVELAWEWFVGTFATIIARVDDASDTRCDNVTPSDAFYCRVPRNTWGFVWLDYFTFINGKERTTGSQRVLCPAELCALPVSTSSATCKRSLLYGVSENYNPVYDRCLDTTGSCANGSPTDPPTTCIVGLSGGLAELRVCDGNACVRPQSLLQPEPFTADCRCPENRVRKAFIAGVDVAQCVADVFFVTIGEGADVISCYFVHLAAFFVEPLAFAFDLVSQVGLLFEQSSLVSVTTRELVRTVQGICFCAAELFRLVADPSGSQGIYLDALFGFLDAVSQLIECGCQVFITIFDGVVATLAEFVAWAREGTPPTRFRVVFDAIFKALIEVVGAIMWFLSAVFYAIAAVPPGSQALIDAADALGPGATPPDPEPNGVALFIKSNALEIAQSIVDVFIFLIDCFVALITIPFKLITCIAQLADNTPGNPACSTVFDTLVPCIETIGGIILDFIDLICGGCLDVIFCIIRYVGCFLGFEEDVPEATYCPDSTSAFFISQDLCDDINVLRLIEVVLCAFRIPVDLTDKEGECPNRAFWCIFFDIACIVENVIYEISAFIELIINESIVALINFIIASINDIEDDFLCVIANCFLSFGPYGCNDLGVLTDECYTCCDESLVTEFAGLEPIPLFTLLTDEAPFFINLVDFSNNQECCLTPITDEPRGGDPCWALSYVALTENAGLCTISQANTYGCWQSVGFATQIFVLQFTFGRCFNTPTSVTEADIVATRASNGRAPLNVETMLGVFDGDPTLTSIDRYCASMLRRATSPPVLLTSTAGGGDAAWSTVDAMLVANDEISSAHRFIGALCASKLTLMTTSSRVHAQLYPAPPVPDLSVAAISARLRAIDERQEQIEREYAENLNASRNDLLAALPPAGSPNMTDVERYLRVFPLAKPSERVIELARNRTAALRQVAVERVRHIRDTSLAPLGRAFVDMRHSYDPAPLVSSVTLALTVPLDVVRLLARYAFNESVGVASADFLVVGRPLQQLEARNCRAQVLPAAIVVDWLSPTVGTLLRGLARAVRTSARTARGLATYESPHTLMMNDRRRAAIRRLVRVAGGATRPLLSVNFAAAVSEGALNVYERGRVSLKRSFDEAPTAADVFDNAVAVSAAITAPRSPATALRRQRLRERYRTARASASDLALQPTSTEKRSASAAPADDGKLARWAARVLQRLDDRHTALLRRALYNTENLDEIRATLDARALAGGGCDLRASPWVCCAEQSVCTECSFLDRLIYSTEDSIEGIVEYYGGDFRSRFLPCAELQAATANYLVVVPALECPAAVCAAPECVSDAECAFSGAPVPAVCNPTLGRCVPQGNVQCADDEGLAGATCLDVGANDQCRAGVCGQLGCQVSPSAPTFPCACRCSDTWLTRDKEVPSIFSRFATLRVPCLLNATCFIESIRPDSLNSTEVPDDHRLRNSWFAAKTRGDPSTPNVDVAFVATLDDTFGGLGTSIIRTIEDVVLRLSSLSGETQWLENFANEYVFCDYRDDLYCPLADTSPATGCCSDRCEERVQGTDLVNGGIFTLLVLVVPLIFLSLCPVLTACNSCFTILWLVVAVPLWLHLSYGGGLLCYTPSALVLLLPFLEQLGVFAVLLVFIVFTLLGFVVRCFTCNFCCGTFAGVCRFDGSLISRVVGVFLSVLIAVVGVFAFVPGLSVCTSLDAYNLFSELVPVCFPLPVVLVDRRSAGAALACGQTITGSAFDASTIINCATTDLLPGTRFLDGIDNVLYAAEQLEPGFNTRLGEAVVNTPLAFLTSYAAAHTTEAHATELVDGLADACFYVTLPSVALSVVILLLDLFISLLLGAAALLALVALFAPLFWAIYALWLMFDAMRQGWVLRRDNEGGVMPRKELFFDGDVAAPTASDGV